MSTAAPSSLVKTIASLQNQKVFAELSWQGTFEDYLGIVRQNPAVTRTAFQRVYDMILSYGQEEYLDNKKRLVRFNFFKDAQHAGQDAIFGLDIPLTRLVSVLKSAAEHYGAERRVILLHGPVGSSKSTIVPSSSAGLRTIRARQRARFRPSTGSCRPSRRSTRPKSTRSSPRSSPRPTSTR